MKTNTFPSILQSAEDERRATLNFTPEDACDSNENPPDAEEWEHLSHEQQLNPNEF